MIRVFSALLICGYCSADGFAAGEDPFDNDDDSPFSAFHLFLRKKGRTDPDGAAGELSISCFASWLIQVYFGEEGVSEERSRRRNEDAKIQYRCSEWSLSLPEVESRLRLYLRVL